MENFALIVAGGSGTRMGHQLPKQFLEVAGKPVLMHTMTIFSDFDPAMQLFLVLPESYHALWQELCLNYGFHLSHRVVSGGDTRFASVKNGLEAISSEGIVFIHDGVRPLVSSDTLSRCLETATLFGNAIPVVPVSESVRRMEGNTTSRANQTGDTFAGELSHPIDRTGLVLIQTPQTFRLSLIREAYQQKYTPEFTDDASVLEKTGETIRLVEGNRHNIKITWPEDLLLADTLLKNRF
jgi:2-C-methyl-D-erythritol 4-phosphate cytidylyltransferase